MCLFLSGSTDVGSLFYLATYFTRLWEYSTSEILNQMLFFSKVNPNKDTDIWIAITETFAWNTGLKTHCISHVSTAQDITAVCHNPDISCCYCCCCSSKYFLASGSTVQRELLTSQGNTVNQLVEATVTSVYALPFTRRCP